MNVVKIRIRGQIIFLGRNVLKVFMLIFAVTCVCSLSIWARLKRKTPRPVPSTHAAVYHILLPLGLTLIGYCSLASYAAKPRPKDRPEAVTACVIPFKQPLSRAERSQLGACLGWRTDERYPICQGAYTPIDIPPVAADEIRIQADETSFYTQERSELKGNVEVLQTQRMVTAETAYLYRDAKTSKVNRIELLGNVRFMEPDHLMIAQKAVINPQDKSGFVEDVLYRMTSQRAGALLPAWGRAKKVQRFANKDIKLQEATYTTCAPTDNAWQIAAEDISLDYAKERGTARNVVVKIRDRSVFYTPYLSFPTSKKRKSGFLLPFYGYSNVGGFDLALPYYWNMAPNYDATIVPHVFSRRGIMMGGDFRYLTHRSTGLFSAHYLPNDRAFTKFIDDNQSQFPSLRGESNNRWSLLIRNQTRFTPHLRMGINFQEVSDNYFLQDFSTNLAVSTENQLLRQADLTYNTQHWLYRAKVTSYQTLQPINQSVVANAYERLPQLLARGAYYDLPLNVHFNLLGQFDYFNWTANNPLKPQGPRFHANPKLSFHFTRPWGSLTPEVQVVENYYDVHYQTSHLNNDFNRTIPRYSVDGGLFFDRTVSLNEHRYAQTLEPRLFYLYVPFHDQTPVPVYDSAYMIFNSDQLFRTNRFSGYDRIGDTNQLTYALTTRWLAEESGREMASLTVGQIRYFADRRVQLCYGLQDNCIDSPRILGNLSSTSTYSPIASRLSYHVKRDLTLNSDYVWDVDTHKTYNGNLNLHYQPDGNKVLSLGYTYLENGDMTQVANGLTQNDALHQATIAYAWPFSDHWSTLGVYNYNISKHYNMMSFFGIQYDTCCWALRLMGGRTFKSIDPFTLGPQYNNNVYFQILLKGLGSAANTDPSTIIHTYLPNYVDVFQH